MQSFWITNFSKSNVTLSDLNITVKAYSSINLLDKKHYSLTEEQLQKSSISGSIFKKSNKISIRLVNPINHEDKILFNPDASIPSRDRSFVKITTVHYPELDISDEVYASEITDIEK